MPAYPIPATLIGKLAVDNPVKGQGLGGELLADALYRMVRASQEIGIFAVRVDAIALSLFCHSPGFSIRKRID